MGRQRHRTQYPGIRYRLVNENRPDGPRRYIVDYWDANGVQHSETLSVGSTLEDARLRKAALESKKTIVDNKRTVGLLLDEYIAARESSLSEKTRKDYAYGVKVVKDAMGRRRLKDLSPNDCASLIAKLRKEGKKAATIKKILTPLQGALRIAVREGWVTGNPLEALLPHERPKADGKKMRCLSSDEIAKLLEAAKESPGSGWAWEGDRWSTLFSLLLFTGLRIGEALALTWDDINGSVRVKAELEGARKTESAEREVMLIPSLELRLKTWKLLSGGRDSDLVFPGVTRRNALRALNACEKRAGIPDYTLHELRHTFASILIAQGETPVLVAHQMGHADPATTLKTYAHLFDAAENVSMACERLQRGVGGIA